MYQIRVLVTCLLSINDLEFLTQHSLYTSLPTQRQIYCKQTFVRASFAVADLGPNRVNRKRPNPTTRFSRPTSRLYFPPLLVEKKLISYEAPLRLVILDTRL